jgi:hypothetical protein
MTQLLVSLQHLPKLFKDLPAQFRVCGHGNTMFTTELPVDGFDFHVVVVGLGYD